MPWSHVVGRTAFAAPVEIVPVSGDAALALRVGSTGAVLVRPDGHEVARWTAVNDEPEPGVAWLG